MSVNCSTMSGTEEYDIALHTFTFENTKDVVVRDCAGAEKFRCDVSAHQLCMDVSQNGGIWSLRLGKPGDLPVGTPVFISVLDFGEGDTQVVFEKATLNNRVIFVGTHDLRYDCVVGTPPPDNGYKRYAYKLDECRINLYKTGSELRIECQCAANPCDSEGHPGFLATTALKS